MSANALKSSKHTHYCAACTVCLETFYGNCHECGSEPPPQGWPAIPDSPYRYLGRIVEGRYLLDQFLGDGATGYVYRAKAMQIHRRFACKIVDTRRYRRKEFEEELLRRFRLEVEAMSRLRNPHVVAIYEAMQLSDGVFALLMDFVDGRTLQDLLDRVGRIKMDRALDIIRQVANGVYEAHSLGFIHRDLKPDNIMIEQLPATGFFARILDFGIVHVMGGVDATQGFRGTPLYASPEQCMGDPGIDHRSDIYSLGAVFYHCITGQPPFPGTESLRVMDAHVNEPPPRISDVLPGSKVPDGLEELLAKSLAKEPGDRPADLSEFIRELDDITRRAESPRRRTSSRAGAARSPDSGRTQHGNPVADPPRERLRTGRLLGVEESEAEKPSDTANRSQVVSPLLEFQLPDAIASDVVAFTAHALNDTGEFATVADQLNRVHVLSLKNDGVYHTLRGAAGLIVSVYLDSSTRRVFACQMDGAILQWSLDATDRPRTVGSVGERVYALAADAGVNRLLAGTERGRVVSVSSTDGKIQTLAESGSPVSALGFSNSEQKLIVGYWGGALSTIHLASKAQTKLDPLPQNAKSIVVSRDGYLAAVLDEAGNVRILNMMDGKPFFTTQSGLAALRALAFAPDGQLMGLGVVRTSMQLWEIRNRPVARSS